MTVVWAGMSLVTTEPAHTVEYAPTVTPGSTVAWVPMVTHSSTVTLPASTADG